MAGKVKEFLGISKIDSTNKKMDDAMEVQGDDNETTKSIMGRKLDKQLNKAKAKTKEKREKRKTLRPTAKTTAGADKNWSEWRKRHGQ